MAMFLVTTRRAVSTVVVVLAVGLAAIPSSALALNQQALPPGVPVAISAVTPPDPCRASCRSVSAMLMARTGGRSSNTNNGS
jgi:hypothetical protein